MNTKVIFSVLATLFILSDTLYAQCTRTSELQRTPVYDVRGTATLTELANGDVTFTLSDDFFTTRGPDVQVFLSSDRVEVDDALFIEDLTEIGHLSGGITFDLPAGTDINKYPYVVFRCFQI